MKSFEILFFVTWLQQIPEFIILKVLCNIIIFTSCYQIYLVGKFGFIWDSFFCYISEFQFISFNSYYEIFIVKIGEWEEFFITNHTESFRFIFFQIFKKFACLNHYIAYIPIYTICHIGLNQNHKKPFYYIFYMEIVLPYFRLVKEEKGICRDI